MVSKSSVKLEYRALAEATCELIWLESLLKEISYPLILAPILCCDNLSASALVANHVFHARTKYIEVDVHFIRDRILAKQLDVRFVPSSNQTADCLTKPLSHSRFQFLRDKLGVIARSLPLSSLQGGVRA